MAGHEAGADTVKARLRDAVELGIEELTVYSFSTENWSRDEAEVAALMGMFARRIELETPELDAEGVRMRFIGRRAAPVPQRPDRADAMGRGDDPREHAGSRCSSHSTTGAGRRSSMQREALPGRPRRSSARHLYAPDMHDPDLIIRTSGEQRISNYLLWQSAYSEFIVPRRAVAGLLTRGVRAGLEEFAARRRRFGGR